MKVTVSPWMPNFLSLWPFLQKLLGEQLPLEHGSVLAATGSGRPGRSHATSHLGVESRGGRRRELRMVPSQG